MNRSLKQQKLRAIGLDAFIGCLQDEGSFKFGEDDIEHLEDDDGRA